MMSRTARCDDQPSVMRVARSGPMPSTSRSRAGSCSITVKTSAPNAATSRFAKCGPIPFSSPDARYFSMPSSDVGAAARSQAALNCRPCVRSCIHAPPAWIASPGDTVAMWPTTVTRSRWPDTCTRSTAKPFSSL